MQLGENAAQVLSSRQTRVPAGKLTPLQADMYAQLGDGGYGGDAGGDGASSLTLTITGSMVMVEVTPSSLLRLVRKLVPLTDDDNVAACVASSARTVIR